MNSSSKGQAGGVLTPVAKWHELKTDPDVFDAVASGAKTCEIRYDDRDFQVGDGLLLRRTRDTGWAMKNTGAPLVYTGEECRRVVSHVLRGYGLEPGWVILSFRPTPAAAADPYMQAIDTALLNRTPPQSAPRGNMDPQASPAAAAAPSDPQNPPIGPSCCGGRPDCDAREECAAAELVAASPAAAGQQSVTKEQALESLSEVGLWLSRDPHALRLRQFIEQASPAAATGAEDKVAQTVPRAHWNGHRPHIGDASCTGGDEFPTKSAAGVPTLTDEQRSDLYCGSCVFRVPPYDKNPQSQRVADLMVELSRKGAASPVAPAGAPTEEMRDSLPGDSVPSLSTLDELARVYSSSYASPNHIAFTVRGLRELLVHLGGGLIEQVPQNGSGGEVCLEEQK